MNRLIKIVAIPAVMLVASLASVPTAKAHWGYGYGYRPYISSYHYVPTYRYVAPVYVAPVYNYGFCY